MTRKYWYMFYEFYCPQCGKTRTIKERVYDKPKPTDYNKRHIITTRWDYCDI